MLGVPVASFREAELMLYRQLTTTSPPKVLDLVAIEKRLLSCRTWLEGLLSHIEAATVDKAHPEL